ncbi:MAG: AAA family ATPase [Bacteroides sp.]|jgi:pgaA protein
MKRLILENFRCFERFEIEFKPGINLLVGDNASGKTSLLKACKYALATFFAGFSDDNTRWVTPQKDDFRQVEVGEISMLEEEPRERIKIAKGNTAPTAELCSIS